MVPSLKLLIVAGARPNFMKIAPLIQAAQAHNAAARNGDVRLEWRLVHTGQHYDARMSDIFFFELGIPAPDLNLEVGSGSHAVQTANLMLKFEPVLLNAFSMPSPGSPTSTPHSAQPDWLVVVGDVNSTMACTLVAAKLGIRVAHVEAGLRSFDRTMPEEINRLVTDAVADLLLTPSEDANEHLKREGVPASRIRNVGNIMIDSLMANLKKSEQARTLGRLGLEKRRYIYVTLHRPANVDCPESLQTIMAALSELATRMPVVFPVHPRTRQRLADFGLSQPSISSSQPSTLHLLDPVGYHDSLALTRYARCVVTDSGGLQEESTYFRTPCLTLRPNTERPVTITLGSNRLVKVPELRSSLDEVLRGPEEVGRIPPFWDGQTAERVIRTLIDF